MKSQKHRMDGQPAVSESRPAAVPFIQTARAVAVTAASRLAAWSLVFALFACVLATVPASGQLTEEKEKCYSLGVDPVHAEVSIGERVDYRFSLAKAPTCPAAHIASLSYAAITPHLAIVPNPGGDVDAAVTPLEGAAGESSFRVTAEIRDDASDELVAEIWRVVELTVDDGVSRPDLRISAFRLPAAIVAGRPFEITATVVNYGYAPTAGGFSNSLVIGARLDGVEACPLLPLGERCDLAFDGWIETPGTYAYMFCADHLEQVEEQREDNNCRTGSFEVIAADAPDLALEAITVSPHDPSVGQPTQVTAVVRNVGGLHSHGSTVTIELPSGAQSLDCPTLAPGGTCSRTVGWTPTGTGVETLVATVVHDAPEEDIENNRRTRWILVDDSHPLPDFVVTVGDITMSPAAPRAGDAITFTVTMRNLGADFVSNVPILALGISGPGLPLTPYLCPQTMLQGEVCEHSVTLTIEQPGPYMVTAIADVHGQIREPDENNNFRALSFAVDGPQHDVACQGLWTLTGLGATTFSTTAPGSVTDACEVRFGQNFPLGCYRTRGDGGLEAVWHRPFGDPCPTSVTVTDPNPPYESWNFTVAIH